MNEQAMELNKTIKEISPAAYSLLSEKGRGIFFPKQGIISQASDARGKKINATIGAAVEGDGSPMRLNSIEKQLNIDPSLVFPYASSYGRLDIREKWKTMIFEKNPSLDGKVISLPVVTSALTHGLSMMAYLFVNPGDKIILSDLYWENYDLIFSNAYGARIVPFNLFKDDGIDLNSLQAAIEKNGGSGKTVLLLNFPNNPAGYTPTVTEAERIVRIISDSAGSGNRILAVLDDAYFGLVYEEGIATESLFGSLSDIHENVLAVKLDGPTKEDYVWGFRVGFMTFGIKGGTRELYSALEAKAAGAIRGSISNAANISQSLLLRAWDSVSYAAEKQEKFKLLQERYNAVKKVFSDNGKYSEYFKPLPFNSGYFMCVNIDEKLDGEKIRHILLNKYSIGVINFGSIIRIAYSSVAVEQIPELLECLYLACTEA
ncbi:MAG: aminotransferase class I/II-fold pyridoxal phosphate-dependent enzyme [Spirochaetales bacterium]|nr:aminotransferase class I/II-fold pyridoxal phosphate-dependent enzyme [Spirochaetales bacterium]